MATRETKASVYATLKRIKRQGDALGKAIGFVRAFQTTPEWLMGLRRTVQVLREMLRLAEAALAAVEANVQPDDQLAQYVRQMELPFEDFDTDEFKEV
jgi:hypothetical protein